MSKSFLLKLIIEILMRDFDAIYKAVGDSSHPRAEAILEKLQILEEVYEAHKAKKKSKS